MPGWVRFGAAAQVRYGLVWSRVVRLGAVRSGQAAQVWCGTWGEVRYGPAAEVWLAVVRSGQVRSGEVRPLR